jgi:hypothetical protein
MVLVASGTLFAVTVSRALATARRDRSTTVAVT